MTTDISQASDVLITRCWHGLQSLKPDRHTCTVVMWPGTSAGAQQNFQTVQTDSGKHNKEEVSRGELQPFSSNSLMDIGGICDLLPAIHFAGACGQMSTT